MSHPLNNKINIEKNHRERKKNSISIIGNPYFKFVLFLCWNKYTWLLLNKHNSNIYIKTKILGFHFSFIFILYCWNKLPSPPIMFLQKPTRLSHLKFSTHSLPNVYICAEQHKILQNFIFNIFICFETLNLMKHIHHWTKMDFLV